MSAKRKLPSDSVLAKWLDEGLNHEQIRARAMEITGEDITLSSVSSALSRAGLTYRVRYDTHIPWRRISVDHNHAYQLSMLRLASRIERGLPVRAVDEKRLNNWIEQLKADGVVVHYEYESPDGFYYCKARPGIDTDLIRVPDEKIDKKMSVAS
jgi:hypothetical protein